MPGTIEDIAILSGQWKCSACQAMNHDLRKRCRICSKGRDVIRPSTQPNYTDLLISATLRADQSIARASNLLNPEPRTLNPLSLTLPPARPPSSAPALLISTPAASTPPVTPEPAEVSPTPPPALSYDPDLRLMAAYYSDAEDLRDEDVA